MLYYIVVMSFVTSSGALVPTSFLLLVVRALLVVVSFATSSSALVPSSASLLVVSI